MSIAHIVENQDSEEDIQSIITTLRNGTKPPEWVWNCARRYIAQWKDDETLQFSLALPRYGPQKLAKDALKLLGSPYVSDECAEEASKLLAAAMDHHFHTQSHRKRQVQSIQRKINFHTECLPELIFKASRIQEGWRSIRCGLAAVGKLDLDFNLDQEVKERDCINESSVIDARLSLEVASYAQQLQLRMKQCRRSLDVRSERKMDAVRRVRRFFMRCNFIADEYSLLVVQERYERRRYDEVCRRWRFFVARLNSIKVPAYIKQVRTPSLEEIKDHPLQDQQQGIQIVHDSMMHFSVTTPQNSIANLNEEAVKMETRRGWMKENASCRRLLARFVTRSLQIGLAHALYIMLLKCHNQRTFSNSKKDHSVPIDHKSSLQIGGKLRIGILSCDVMSGLRYMQIYQTLFNQLATSHTIDWYLYDCTSSNFPSRSMQRFLDGILILGNLSSLDNTFLSTENMPYSDELKKCLNPGNLQLTRIWRKKLIAVLQRWCNKKRIQVAAVGQGHVFIGESLGGQVMSSDWKMGWNVINLGNPSKPPTTSQNVHKARPRTKQYENIHLLRSSPSLSYIHGEYISNIPSHAINTFTEPVQVFKSKDQKYVSCLRNSHILSFDGLLSCENFRMEIMREIYEYNQKHSPDNKAQKGIATKLTDLAGRVREALENERQQRCLKDASKAVGTAILSHFLASDKTPRKKTVSEDMPVYVPWNRYGSISGQSHTTLRLKGVILQLDVSADHRLIVLTRDDIPSRRKKEVDTEQVFVGGIVMGLHQLPRILQKTRKCRTCSTDKPVPLYDALNSVQSAISASERASMVAEKYKSVRRDIDRKEIILLVPNGPLFCLSTKVNHEVQLSQKVICELLRVVETSLLRDTKITIVSCCLHVIQHLRRQRPDWKYLYHCHGNEVQHFENFSLYRELTDGILIPAHNFFHSSWCEVTSVRENIKKHSLKLYAAFGSFYVEKRESHALRSNSGAHAMHTNHLGWLNASRIEASIASCMILKQLGVEGTLIASHTFTWDTNITLRPEMRNSVARVLKRWEERKYLIDPHEAQKATSNLTGKLHACSAPHPVIYSEEEIVRNGEEFIKSSIKFRRKEQLRKQQSLESRCIETSSLDPLAQRSIQPSIQIPQI